MGGGGAACMGGWGRAACMGGGGSGFIWIGGGGAEFMTADCPGKGGGGAPC